MAVTLEAIRNSHIISRAASCDHHLRRNTWRVTWMEKIMRLFVCFSQEDSFNILCFM